MHTYYQVTAALRGEDETEVLFGSYDKQDCVYELDAEKESWKADGYVGFKIRSFKTTVAPDANVYPYLNWS